MSENTIVLPAYTPGEQGLFSGLPAEVYHSQSKAPGISRSLIVELLTLTAAHAQSAIEGLHTKVETAAMSSGTVFDKMLLEPDKFGDGISHWTVPADMKLSTKEGIAWKKDHPKTGEPGGLPYIWAESDAADKASLEDMSGMIESLMAHEKIRRIVESSVKQESAFCKDPDTGLMRKVRPDARCVDNQDRIIIADLKSTFRGGAVISTWQQHCARMAYHIQDSFYSDVYTDLMAPPFFVFMVVERKPPYACRMFQLDRAGKRFAREKYKRALEKFRQCEDSGVWPGYGDEIVTVSLPTWELRAPQPESIDL